MKTICPAKPNVRIAVTGHGVGIPSENLARTFTPGFATKKGGHDFALQSARPGHSALFILERREQSKAQAT